MPNRVVVEKNRDGILGDVDRIRLDDPEAISKIGDFCQQKFSDVCRVEYHTGPHGNSLGIFAAEADKGNALDWVMDHLDVGKQEVMAIGDQIADISMFSRARIKVAMGNGLSEVKQEATVVAPANYDEGVAWVLKEYRIVP